MCAGMCPCSRPMTRPALVKDHDTTRNLLLVKVQQIGDRFIDVTPGTTYKPKDVVTVRARHDGTWELTDR